MDSKKSNKCFNCIYKSEQFKIANRNYIHCLHPKYKDEDFESGTITPWDTLNEVYNTCEDFERK